MFNDQEEDNTQHCKLFCIYQFFAANRTSHVDITESNKVTADSIR